jgi:hypothetical protein
MIVVKANPARGGIVYNHNTRGDLMRRRIVSCSPQPARILCNLLEKRPAFRQFLRFGKNKPLDLMP